jgi:cytochrome bd ubiquinol oxidase subunit II
MSVLLPELIALIIVVALTAYVLMAGADFGGGVWDLFARGPRQREQRALIAEAITPIWEANHVWLIFVVVLLFTCFPPVFSRLSVTLHIPLTLLLVGIVLRGAAFTFRAYDDRKDAAQRTWGTIFSVASLVTPVLLGVCVGAVAGERVLPPQGSFADAFVWPWLTPFALAVGGLTLALFAFLAAVYLTLEAKDVALCEDFRARALIAAATVFVMAGLALLLSHPAAPRVREGLTTSPWAVPLHINTGIAALVAIGALWRRRYRVARIAAGAQATLILWGWAIGQYPFLVPPDLTISEAAAPEATLRLVLIAVAAGALVLVPSLVYLFRVFKAHLRAGAGQEQP